MKKLILIAFLLISTGAYALTQSQVNTQSNETSFNILLIQYDLAKSQMAAVKSELMNYQTLIKSSVNWTGLDYNISLPKVVDWSGIGVGN